MLNKDLLGNKRSTLKTYKIDLFAYYSFNLPERPKTITLISVPKLA